MEFRVGEISADKKYLLSHPWAKTLRNIAGRCSQNGTYGKRGIKSTLTTKDLKFLWFRDKAYLMKQPSIDRINTTKNYSRNNCRYLELKENKRLGRLNKTMSNITKNKIKQSLRGKHLSPDTEFKLGHKYLGLN